MESININKTDSSPKIILDYSNGLIEFEGKCYPENTFDFFEPLIAWIKNYFKGNTQELTTVNIKLTYFNSATTQVLFDILDIIQDGKSNDLIINWFYDSKNENDLEDYEDYSKEFPNLDIKAIPFE